MNTFIFRLIIICICLMPFSLRAFPPEKTTNVPEKIVSITQVLHEPGYYVQQVDLWNKELKKDNTNPDAWMNYYLACRIVNMLNQDSNPHDLDEIYSELAVKIPNTYEYHYLSYLNGKGDTSLFHHLEKAYKINPNRAEVYSHHINYYELNRDLDGVKEFSSKWLESGAISTGILNWNYNQLMSLEKDAILLTQGDNDTYPSWMLQYAHSVRPDVKVININLLRQKKYCDAILQENGIGSFPNSIDENLTWKVDFTPLANHIFNESKRRPVYMNVAIPKSIRDNFSDKLYTVGLAFKYTPYTFDNLAVLKNNYENKFLKDYLLVDFQKDKSESVLNTMNLNYLPAFVTLYKHYKASEEKAKAEMVRKIIFNIAKAGGKEKEIIAILENKPQITEAFETLINIKQIDKKMQVVKPGLWAADTETTNENYEQFLMDLLRNKEFELLEKCKTTKTDWRSLLPKMHQHLSEEKMFFNGNPDDALVPVQNISYEAAKAYCEWLTKAYNTYSKKKNHLKVRFRLPTVEEWEYAASGGHKESSYPWGFSTVKNVKGCYLSNFYVSEEPICDDCPDRFKKFPDIDGGFFPVKADAYFPNDYGLYGMCGNLAEMVEEKGIAKGGSWEDIPEECKIQSIKKYDEPSPAIGFRVFMELVK